MPWRQNPGYVSKATALVVLGLSSAMTATWVAAQQAKWRSIASQSAVVGMVPSSQSSLIFGGIGNREDIGL